MSAPGARAAFARAFGRPPAVVASAPGRVNLIGEHTDYNGGDVLPMAIQARTYVAMDRSRDMMSSAFSNSHQPQGIFAMDRPERGNAWWDYVAGPLWMLSSLGIELPNVDVAVVSNVPTGAGLSSSAALEMATLVAVAALCRASPGLPALARAAHRAEGELVGVPCGIMDQFASALARQGHALYLACDTERVEHVPFGGSILVFDTAVMHYLRTSPYATRRMECQQALRAIAKRFPDVHHLARASMDQLKEARLPSPLHERAQHVIEETIRVENAVVALRSTGKVPGSLLYASHRSLRTLYDCSTPEFDWFVEEAAGRDGVTGARLTGAGWGGCAIATGAPETLREFAKDAAAAYQKRFAREARWWITLASPGAGVDWAHPSLT